MEGEETVNHIINKCSKLIQLGVKDDLIRTVQVTKTLQMV